MGVKRMSQSIKNVRCQEAVRVLIVINEKFYLEKLVFTTSRSTLCDSDLIGHNSLRTIFIDDEQAFYHYIFISFDKSRYIDGNEFNSSYWASCQKLEGHKNVNWNHIEGLEVRTSNGTQGFIMALYQIIRYLNQIVYVDDVIDELKLANRYLNRVLAIRQKGIRHAKCLALAGMAVDPLSTRRHQVVFATFLEIKVAMDVGFRHCQ